MAKKLVNSLPFDFFRCSPYQPDAYCRSCARWDHVEGQTRGERTPVMYGFENSVSESCRYLAATWEEIDNSKAAEQQEGEDNGD